LEDFRPQLCPESTDVTLISDEEFHMLANPVPIVIAIVAELQLERFSSRTYDIECNPDHHRQTGWSNP
jgi:hypothetical protein